LYEGLKKSVHLPGVGALVGSFAGWRCFKWLGFELPTSLAL